MVRVLSNGKSASIARRHLVQSFPPICPSRKNEAIFTVLFSFVSNHKYHLLLRAVLVLGRRGVEHDVVLARLQLGKAVTTDLVDERMIE